jgi:phosphoenolpyruvate-protein kinase (PTS system EI component)
MTSKEQHFDGLGVATGIAIGPAYVRQSGAIDVPERKIPKKKIASEQKRLQVAIRLARRQIRLLQSRATAKSGANGEELIYLLDAYVHMLQDSRLVRGAEKRIADDQINAEAAVKAEIAAIAEVFQSMDDSYIAARIDDIREVGNRLLRNLTKTPVKPFSAVPAGSIIIAEQLSPADTAQLDPERIAGAATTGGSAEGHTAIMARALGLPTVLGAPGLTAETKTGDTIIVDGNAGRVIVNPTARTISAYERRRTEHRKQTRRLDRLRSLAAVTRDAVAITLEANVELPIEMDMVTQAGAEGVGLLRTEFMFMNRDDIPSEDEQVAQLKSVIDVSEVRKAREILKKSAEKLTRQGIKIPDPLPPLGVMIEVPGAALAADALAQHSDFFAIGSNDLTMYTLAIDRGNEHVAHLFDPLHPGLLRLLQFTANAALRARIPISVCGEMAGDPRYTALLLGLGIRELSMTPSSIPLVKQRIRELDLAAASHRAGVIMDQVDAGRIAMLLDDFNALA